MSFLVQLIIGFGLAILSYLLAPKPATDQPDTTKDFEAPTAEAGRPIPVVFGTLTFMSPNVLWYGDKKIREYTTGGGGKKS